MTSIVVYQDVREGANLAGELPVGEGAPVPRLPLPDDRGLVPAPRGEMPVEAVLADVELSAGEPARVGRRPVENGLPGTLPVQRRGLAGPIADVIGGGRGVQGAVADLGRGREGGRRREAAVLAEEDVDVGHRTMLPRSPSPPQRVRIRRCPSRRSPARRARDDGARVTRPLGGRPPAHLRRPARRGWSRSRPRGGGVPRPLRTEWGGEDHAAATARRLGPSDGGAGAHRDGRAPRGRRAGPRGARLPPHDALRRADRARERPRRRRPPRPAAPGDGDHAGARGAAGGGARRRPGPGALPRDAPAGGDRARRRARPRPDPLR